MIYVNRLYALNETQTLHDRRNKFSIKADEVTERLFEIDDIIADKLIDLFEGKNYVVMNVAQLIKFKEQLEDLVKETTEDYELEHLNWGIDRLNGIIIDDGYYYDTSNYYAWYSLEVVWKIKL